MRVCGIIAVGINTVEWHYKKGVKNMIRGTTPTLLFNLPFSASIIKSAEITIKYVDEFKKMLIKKTLEDCELGEKNINLLDILK